MNKTVTRRTLLNGFLALALIPCLAQAQRTIPVEVVNTSAAPMPVVVQSGSGGALQRRLVGFTEQTVRGNDGILSLNGACATDFPGSRMCTTVEIFNSLPPNLTGNADRGLVRPVLVPAGLTTADGTPLVMDVATGRTGVNSRISCNGYTAGALALVMSVEGFFAATDCNTETNVACCAAAGL